MTWTIRLATQNDAHAIAEIYKPAVVSSPASFELEPPDAREMARRIADAMPAYPWLVMQSDSGVVGYAYGSRHRARTGYNWSVETSVYVHENFPRRGIGKALYEALLPLLTAQGFANAYAGITLPNAGSVRLHEILGFEPIGTFRRVGYKFGAWHDVGWWHLPLIETASADMQPPRMLNEVEFEPRAFTPPSA